MEGGGSEGHCGHCTFFVQLIIIEKPSSPTMDEIGLSGGLRHVPG